MSEVRYERKFVTRELALRELEFLVQNHPASFREIYERRWIDNIYFDSFDLRAVCETLDGLGRREKLRIRWYGDFIADVEKPMLERKAKRGFVVEKSAWPLPPFSVGPALSRRTVDDALRGASLPEPLALRMRGLRPVLFNRYARRYYGSLDGRFRITIDEGLCFHAFRTLGACLMQWAEQRSLLVLELKYAAGDDDRADWVLQHLPLRLSRNSKYVNGMSLVYPSVQL